MIGEGAISGLGARAVAVARDAGGIAITAAQVVGALFPPSFDLRELRRHLYQMGVRSLPIIVLTAFFTGGLMVIQSGLLVKQLGAASLVGWGTGYVVLREVGPILIALMFSGRVGSNNAAELGTMTVTEQVDGLRALAIDPISYLVVPRVVAMVTMLFALTIIGDLVAIVGGMLMSKALLDIEYVTFYQSLTDTLHPADLLHGLYKSIAFGCAIAVTSCYFGLSVRGGAVGVGRAVNAAVVAAAISILLIDFFLTYLLG